MTYLHLISIYATTAASAFSSDSPVAPLIILVVLLIVCALVFFFIRILGVRVRQAVAKSVDVNNMMNQALSAGQSYVVEYDLKTLRLHNQYCGLLTEKELTVDELLAHVDPSQQQRIANEADLLKRGVKDMSELHVNWHDNTLGHQRNLLLGGHMLLERDESGTPQTIVLAFRDETRKVSEENHNRDLANRYMTIFDTNMVAMSFYDPDGMVIDFNQKMKELCGFDGKGEEFFGQLCLFDFPVFRDDFDRNSHDFFHACQRMHYPEAGIDKYIEFRVLPTFNDADELAYYVVTARDITGERAMYLQQRRNEKELQQTNDIIGHYERELQYLLKNSDMYVWTFDLKTRMITFSRSLKEVEFTMSRNQYIEWMVEEEREEADRNLMKMITTGSPFNAVHHFNYTPATSHPCWYALNGMPTRNAGGQIIGYFGVCRDITKLMEAQQQLRKETQRAEDSGIRKSTFLANMTHEIRTPLNAIVGFSDLLPMIEDEAEKKEFIRIIRNNCDMLFRLINDILEASNIESTPLAIVPADVDFAQVFNDICQTLAQRVQEPSVEFVKENPYDTFPTHLDKGRMQQVITNFVTNAVKYTHQGYIKVGYKVSTNPKAALASDGQVAGQPEELGIYMYCEDTGAGIPKEKQASVFERFVKLNDYVQGTGLGLSICQSIAKRCNGSIGIDSEGEGRGSTFWIWVPCSVPECIKDKAKEK